ncbi:bifunctional helix-turn-helix domain-containing protein/methylated-DNA--[protein]-cysteine S-methyltransferase [Leptospira interrogans]|uniref:methylated-DNA--[protein]-cysteine S-methyltransferase n=1 Tax=Leptospira interrogans serovar Lora str. TE 1992 TaxID=1193028 RepID=M3DS06_LEPIR|nr:methylated-DNA--[protein]-cysteine S-methyltransferase [Leptospira interrogans]EMF43968.1 DNA-binding domain, methylated-DNA-[protein]-cysteine S-methyltransferase family protein [Leptospira interrogans serovar Lora str. TE 1992]AKH78754.1 cysteine methyltransferase [Leptospira interrogans serovar Bratislava]EMN09214.1 methylated-DNA--[protein]-cysteine S-methyltransferase [Leptospira interrogans serovar Muenchen str. Brem 129]KLO75627.1 Methylated-DNA--(protein)-cysteine S-methyltransferase
MDHYKKISEAIQFIQKNAISQPELDEVAKSVNLSPFHFQRLFTEWAGVSPKQFLQYITLQNAKSILSKPQTTLFDAAFETGLSGTSRLHDLFVKIEGMTPGEFKNGGENIKIRYSFQKSIFGDYLIASTEKGICNLFFYDIPKEQIVSELKEQWERADIIEQMDENQNRVIRFFDKTLNGHEKIKLHLKGTEFQIKVWEALLKIPEGQLSSYSDIADLIGQENASRAVGTAIGKNPIGYLIPCHRVIKSTGGIGEYRWGSERKMAMIGWEASKVKI